MSTDKKKVFIMVGISHSDYAQMARHLYTALVGRGFTVTTRSEMNPCPGLPDSLGNLPKVEFTEHFLQCRITSQLPPLPSGEMNLSEPTLRLRPALNRNGTPFTRQMRVSLIGEPNTGKSLLMRLMSLDLSRAYLCSGEPTFEEVGDFPTLCDQAQLEEMVPMIVNRVEIYMLVYPLRLAEAFSGLGFEDMLNEQ